MNTMWQSLARFGNRPRVWRCRVRAHVVLLEVESEMEKFRARTFATKEPETLDWIERYVKPGDVVYDVGANIGLYALFAAKHMGGRGTVYAFEPEALNHARLSKNIHLNHLSGVVVPCCMAVADRLGFDRLYLHPHRFAPDGRGLVSGAALHSFGRAVDYRGQPFHPCHQQGTVGVPLDHLWQAWGLEFPTHVKIDVDGLEDDVMAGATKTLEDPRLKSILVEVEEDTGSEGRIIQRLTAVGFQEVTDFPVQSGDLLKGTPYEGCKNYVFIRRDQ